LSMLVRLLEWEEEEEEEEKKAKAIPKVAASGMGPV